MTHAHLSDDQLIAWCAEGTDRSAIPATVVDCDVCSERLTALAVMLHEVTTAAERRADAAFPPERRSRQHARILQRLAHQGQLARVLAFPRASRVSVPPNPMRRWVAGAAAAGLVVGMVADRLAHELPGLGSRSGQPSMFARSSGPLRGSASATSDDDFLREIELAVSSSPEGLRRLESLTPVAWEQPQ